MKKSTKNDALTEEEIQRLLDACEETEQPLKYKFIFKLSARMGLRTGEIGHITRKWVDFKEKTIQIPKHDPCDCNYCRQMAKQKAEYNDQPFEKALEDYWSPKSDAAARKIPYDFDEKTEKVIEKAIVKLGDRPVKPKSVNRHIQKIAGEAKINNVYPHRLRSTAATRLAYNGVNSYQLATFMGWKKRNIAGKICMDERSLNVDLQKCR